MNIEKGFYYTQDHEWLKVEGNVAYVGISDYAQDHLGDIVYIELPEVDDEFEKGEAFGSVESVKTASDVIMPISGKVIEINEDLNDSPEDVNDNAYEAWFIKIEFEDESELRNLMGDSQYQEYIDKED